MKILEVGEKDILAMKMLDETTQKLKAEGHQVLMVADNFKTSEGTRTVTSVEIDRKGNGVMSMLIDLINSIYAPRGIYFSTAYEFLGREAKARGLM